MGPQPASALCSPPPSEAKITQHCQGFRNVNIFSLSGLHCRLRLRPREEMTSY